MDVELLEIRDFLAGHAPFDALPAQVLDQLPARCTLRYVRRGTTVLSAGEPGDRLFVVRSGAVDISDEGTLVDRVGAGGAFGMSSLVEHVPTRYDVVAREDTLLLSLPQVHFDALVAQHPVLAVHFAATHHERIRTAIARLRTPTRGSAVLRTRVRDLVRSAPVSTPPRTPVAEAARVMTRAGVSSLLVMEGEELLGIVTDRDLRRRVLAADLEPGSAVADVMTPGPVTVRAEGLALEAMLEMTGRNIHHLPVVDAAGVVLGLVTTTDLVRLERSNPVYLVADIQRQETVAGVAEQAARVPAVVEQLVSQDVSAADVGRVVSSLTDVLTVRLVALAEAELGDAPAPWAWVCLGSAAREERALGGDQDHALVLADRADPQDPWWGRLAETVTSGLERCGLPRCDGEVMATDPGLRLRAPDWRERFARWAHRPTPAAVLSAAIFYDMRCVHGERSLVQALREDAVAMGSRSDLLVAHLTAQASRMRPPLGFFRGFVLEPEGEHRDTLDLKRGIGAVVQLARVASLRAGSTELETGERLAVAGRCGVLPTGTATDLADAHELFCSLRLQHQAGQVREGLTPDNHLDPSTLGGLDRRHLRDAFQIVRTAQQSLAARLPQVT